VRKPSDPEDFLKGIIKNRPDDLGELDFEKEMQRAGVSRVSRACFLNAHLTFKGSSFYSHLSLPPVEFSVRHSPVNFQIFSDF
jgi:hypothetical protein